MLSGENETWTEGQSSRMFGCWINKRGADSLDRMQRGHALELSSGAGLADFTL